MLADASTRLEIFQTVLPCRPQIVKLVPYRVKLQQDLLVFLRRHPWRGVLGQAVVLVAHAWVCARKTGRGSLILTN